MGRRVHLQKRFVSWVNSVLRQFLTYDPDPAPFLPFYLIFHCLYPYQPTLQEYMEGGIWFYMSCNSYAFIPSYHTFPSFCFYLLIFIFPTTFIFFRDQACPNPSSSFVWLFNRKILIINRIPIKERDDVTKHKTPSPGGRSRGQQELIAKQEGNQRRQDKPREGWMKVRRGYRGRKYQPQTVRPKEGQVGKDYGNGFHLLPVLLYPLHILPWFLSVTFSLPYDTILRRGPMCPVPLLILLVFPSCPVLSYFPSTSTNHDRRFNR